MAKLYFYYSAMNAGKTTTLLQSSYNYNERGMETLLLTPRADDRFGSGQITSRIGLKAPATVFDETTDLFALATHATKEREIHCIMVDEAQFLSREQVYQLCQICDQIDIPVLAFGIRTDFRGEPFEGSKYLLAWADNLKEIKAICRCGRKATMVLRIDEQGQVIKDGAQVEIGGNDRYISMCRQHFTEAFTTQKSGTDTD